MTTAKYNSWTKKSRKEGRRQRRKKYVEKTGPMNPRYC
jgi:hypothetical protein